MEKGADGHENKDDAPEVEVAPEFEEIRVDDDGYGLVEGEDDTEEPADVDVAREMPSKRQMHRALFGFNRRSGGKKYRRPKKPPGKKMQKDSTSEQVKKRYSASRLI